MASKILIIGACGQIGSELTFALRDIYGSENVIASDISYGNLDIVNSGIFEIVDAINYASLKTCVEKFNIDTVYLMAALLSANGVKFPMWAWDLNMTSLFVASSTACTYSSITFIHVEPSGATVANLIFVCAKLNPESINKNRIIFILGISPPYQNNSSFRFLRKSAFFLAITFSS